MKCRLTFLFVLSAMWLLAAMPERKVVFPFAATLTNNSLNQYVGITTPGYENILGAALATNSVTVNGGLADRKGEYFHREISVANTNQPVWQNVTNIAGTFTNKGGSVFPANGQALAYDADGNLSAATLMTSGNSGARRDAYV